MDLVDYVKFRKWLNDHYRKGESYYLELMQGPDARLLINYIGRIYVVGRILGFSPDEIDEFILEAIHNDEIIPIGEQDLQTIGKYIVRYFSMAEIDVDPAEP